MFFFLYAEFVKSNREKKIDEFRQKQYTVEVFGVVLGIISIVFLDKSLSYINEVQKRKKDIRVVLCKSLFCMKSILLRGKGVSSKN